MVEPSDVNDDRAELDDEDPEVVEEQAEIFML
jgi:hypothetical protein